MKRFIFLLIALSCSTYSNANEFTFAKTFTSDTKCVAISTNVATATQILTNDAFVQRTWIVNPSTMSVFISSFTSVSLSTTTLFAIPASSGTIVNGSNQATAPVQFSPDGPLAPYSGPMWASSNPGGSQETICIFRVK